MTERSFYLTFDNSTDYPFKNTYVVVEAESRDEAAETFHAFHPCRYENIYDETEAKAYVYPCYDMFSATIIKVDGRLSECLWPNEKNDFGLDGNAIILTPENPEDVEILSRINNRRKEKPMSNNCNITADDICCGLTSGIVKIVPDPNLTTSADDPGCVCQIGDNWFYFGGDKAEQLTTAEYLNAVPMPDIAAKIKETLDELSDCGFEDEVSYYEAVIREAGTDSRQADCRGLGSGVRDQRSECDKEEMEL